MTLATGLKDTKNALWDLCERQLNDLHDSTPSDQRHLEDIDKLLGEMQLVRRCMETMILFEHAVAEAVVGQ